MSTSEVVVETPALNQEQIAAAFTNSPVLATDEFVLGGRTFKVLDLGYRQHIQFTAMLQPLFGALAGKAAEKAKVILPAGISLGPSASELNPSGLVTFLQDKLPAMVCIVCNMESIVKKDPSLAVDAQWVEDHARSPYELAKIVFKQINKNNMIREFMDFFVQGLPLMMAFSK